MVKHLILFVIGGSIYSLFEILWRGFTHPSMFIVAGIAFITIGLINELFTWNMPLWLQCGITAMIITGLEFISGCIINLWFGWNVWDYSNEAFNVAGQICLKMSVLWYVLSGAGIILDDILRWKLFGEEKPHYKIL